MKNNISPQESQNIHNMLLSPEALSIIQIITKKIDKYRFQTNSEKLSSQIPLDISRVLFYNDKILDIYIKIFQTQELISKSQQQNIFDFFSSPSIIHTLKDINKKLTKNSSHFIPDVDKIVSYILHSIQTYPFVASVSMNELNHNFVKYRAIYDGNLYQYINYLNKYQYIFISKENKIIYFDESFSNNIGSIDENLFIGNINKEFQIFHFNISTQKIDTHYSSVDTKAIEPILSHPHLYIYHSHQGKKGILSISQNFEVSPMIKSVFDHIQAEQDCLIGTRFEDNTLIFRHILIQGSHISNEEITKIDCKNKHFSVSYHQNGVFEIHVDRQPYYFVSQGNKIVPFYIDSSIDLSFSEISFSSFRPFFIFEKNKDLNIACYIKEKNKICLLFENTQNNLKIEDGIIRNGEEYFYYIDEKLYIFNNKKVEIVSEGVIVLKQNKFQKLISSVPKVIFLENSDIQDLIQNNILSQTQIPYKKIN